MFNLVGIARSPFVERAKASKWRKTCSGRLLIPARIIRTQEAVVGIPMEDTNKAVTISSNNNPTDMGHREVTNSNPSTGREATVKMRAMAALRKHSLISNKANSNSPNKEVMELHQPLRLCLSGNPQQHPMVKHTITTKDRERRPGKSLRECHRGYRGVVKTKRFQLPRDVAFDERRNDVCCLTRMICSVLNYFRANQPNRTEPN
mmetsp:Transcript_8943/g.26644  ORF Transcript_8943/g.26644 Transcript_8943/m.26644 type:complete len:205 (+) Transcript_8943:215-829(+)